MDYKLFNAEEFAADESFIAYYLKQDEKAVEYWANWISHHPEKLDEVLNAERLLAIVHLRLTDQEQETAFDRFNEFLDAAPADEENELTVLSTEGAKGLRKLNFRLITIAASIFLILSIGGLFLYNQPAQTSKTEYVTIHNGYGMIKILSLADGTKVSLNANSTLTYPGHFETNRRDVTLKGEAFFEVAKDKNRPFTVSANGTTTRVLGTKFNISAYTDKVTTVALQEGSVEFESDATLNSHKIILKPSEMVTWTKSADQLKLSTFNPKTVTAWTNGVILFDHASFTTIATQFKNTYGIELKDNTRSQQWNYSGQFTKSHYLTILKSICFAKNLTYKQNNNTITLTNN